MRRHITLVLLSLFISSCNEPTPSENQAAQNNSNGTNSSYTPFPSGYGYMQNPKALQKATDDGDHQTIREHAWKLWAGIMQPASDTDWPLWYTWPNTKAAFSAFTPVEPINEGAESSTNTLTTGESIIAKNLKNAPDVNTPAPTYDIPEQVIRDYPAGICKDSQGNITVCDGANFLFNGDIMIPTESLSREAMENLRNKRLYLASTLDQLHKKQIHQIEVTQKFIVTKHMYWPVKANGITGVPVWKNNFPPSYTGYAGYEKWDTLVGIDPSGKSVGQTREVAFLYGVKNHAGTAPLPTVKADATVYGLDQFYYHKVTAADWASFDSADKAIINAASYWANNQAFGPGDYLVTIAMHINTKELPSWTLQSVWWSDEPGQGPYAADRPAIPQAVGPWDHYLLTDAYAVPPNSKGGVDIAVNPYIEGVIHPIATNCRNCHVRAGWPTGSTAGTASYQNPDCPELLSYLTPDSECLKSLTLSDYLWIIPDRAVKK